MAEHDQQSTVENRDCSVLSDAPSEEATQAVNELSEASRRSDAQSRRQAHFNTEEPASQFRPFDPPNLPNSDRLPGEERTQSGPSNGGSGDVPRHPNQHFSTEQLDKVLTSSANRSRDTPSLIPAPVQQRSALPAKFQSRLYDPANPHMQALIEQAPSLGLDLEKCKDRCGFIIFDVLTPAELPDHFKKHKESLSMILAELKPAVAAHLGTSPDYLGTDLRVEEFVQALYYKAREELHHAAGFQQSFPPVAKAGSFFYDQLHRLMQVLREVDKKLRDVDEADLPVFEACCTVAAMKWQIDIHKHWIAELGGDKKRKNRDGDDSASPLRKHRRTTSVESTSDENSVAPKRRPGRPPGALNKTTVAAREREAAIAAARDQSVELPTTPTPAPRPRGPPMHYEHQGLPTGTIPPRSMLPQSQQHINTPTRELLNQYPPSTTQFAQSSTNPQNYATQSGLFPTSGRRNAVSSGGGHMDPNLPQQVESLSSGSHPQFHFFDHPNISYHYYGHMPNQQPGAFDRFLEEGDNESEENL
ncbi:hypothetical protein LTR70_002345 [Exophiala xenobiotica]|uniref:Uncharacterized protein n=1 Tax=Lithohypha guttulata TaxID=1690604 RepID=A0ABR0KN16_9EURO|nr:hypothetical protein LTR24_001234 [Lithohypha guttulata]KAK5326080.1 hypothetical protein LTR70_002345 [Exophiala xenobiotica]